MSFESCLTKRPRHCKVLYTLEQDGGWSRNDIEASGERKASPLPPRVSRPRQFSAFQQDGELAHDFGAGVGRQTRREFRLARAPIETLDLISQDDSFHGQTRRKGDLKWVTLHLARNGTEQTEANLAVVRTGRHNNRGSSPRLLVSDLRIQADPDDVTTFWNVGHGATRPLDQPPTPSRLRYGDSSS
jgi:hypothetical protein